MSLMDQYTLATNGGFIERVQAAIIAAAIAIYNEVANDVQTLALSQGTATGGTFTLTFNGQTTGAIAYNASAGTVQLALVGLSTIGTSNVLCTGGPLPSNPITITFQGSLGAAPQNAITIANTLTGTGTPTYAVTHTTVGMGYVGHSGRAGLASRILANPSGYASLFAIGVATNAQVQMDYLASGANPANVTDADISNAVSAMWNCYT